MGAFNPFFFPNWWLRDIKFFHLMTLPISTHSFKGAELVYVSWWNKEEHGVSHTRSFHEPGLKVTLITCADIPFDEPL